MVSFRYALAAAVSATLAVAHMELLWPPPLRSKFNPNTPWADINYSMNSPLIADGTYPCKGFITTPDDPSMGAVTTWSAGETYNYTVQGTAVHGGGSCQLAMSYDFGKTWQVIYSVIGGCLVDGLTTEFVLPKDAPTGEAVFSWNWFNRIGNREMYANCAVINIVNGGSGLSPSVYPTPFVANAGVNDCTTVANTDAVFPEPGPNVRYGGEYANGNVKAPGFGITGTNCYGPGEKGGSTPAGSNPGTGSGSGSPSAASSAAASASATVAATASSAWSEPSVSASSAALADPSAYASSAWSEPSASVSSAAYGASASASAAWSEPSSSYSRIGYNHAAESGSVSAAASATESAAAVPTSTTGRCRRRKRAIPALRGHGHVAARHERFVTRQAYEQFAPRRMYEQAQRGPATA